MTVTTTERQRQRLADWMRHTHVSASAPADWGASGECARLLATTLLRYATALGGDLTHGRSTRRSADAARRGEYGAGRGPRAGAGTHRQRQERARTSQPVLLDLFCGAGGAGAGYTRAGLRVVGVDINPRPLRHNPHECYVGDALVVLDTLLAGERWQGYWLHDFQAIHASPPCQDYTRTRYISHPRGRHNGAIYPRLITPIRQRLEHARMPWIIENVTDAAPDMPDAIMLCGTSFGLRVWRHRLFSSSHLLYAAGVCRHRAGDVSVRCKHSEYIGMPSGITYRDGKGYTRQRPRTARLAAARAAMGIDWMDSKELGEAIPPAYTHWLGMQLLAAIRQEASA